MLDHSHKFCVDTRKLQPDDIFVALSGEKTDGHQFLAEAAAKKAHAAIVMQGYTGPDYGLKLIPAADPLLTLQNLAREKLSQNRKVVVAVTGTVGKTSCKEFMMTLLSEKFKVAGTQNSENSKITLPTTILNQSGKGEDVLVLEMGMSKPGEIARLIEIAPPTIAVITAVSLVHAENFQSLEDIALAKGEILSHPETKLGLIPQGESLLNSIGSCPKKNFSPYEGFCPLPKHQRENLGAAIAVCEELGMSQQEILQGLPKLALPKGRGNHIYKNNILFIDDAYNASPRSVKAALESLPSAKGKRIAVLGEMLELGKFSEPAHQETGAFALDHLDQLFCFGPQTTPMVEAWQSKGRDVSHFDQKNLLIQALKECLRPGDVILLKGSHANRLWEVLEEF